MARRHKPALLKIITGSKRLPPYPEPAPQGDLVEAPAWLTEPQKETWRYAIEHAPHGLLRKIDQSILTVWCVAATTFREASEKIAQEGVLVKTLGGAQQVSPYVHIRNRQMILTLRAAAELGFSPASRAGVAASIGDGGNPFSRNGRRPGPAA